MPFVSQIKLLGNKTTYFLDPNIKSYSLIDIGFKKTNRGNYKLIRQLDLNNQISYKLKIIINPDLNQFKMSILDSTGFRRVNLFNSKHQAEIEQFKYFMNELSIKDVIKSK